MTSYKTKLTIILALLLVGGCAVTPQTITPEEVKQKMADDLRAMYLDQEPVTGPISMYEAIARAIKYNLDHRLKMMEDALARGQLELVKYDQLPELTASAGYNRRSNFSGASSQSLLTGAESLEPSTSAQKNIVTVGGTVVWNLLDFGVSYALAQQQADQVLITEERRRKVVQNIVQDVRYAYWRAVSAQRLLGKMDSVLKRTYSALENSRQLESLRIQSPIQSLGYQKALLEIIREMWVLRKELASAKTELAALMNLKPGTQYTVIEPSEGQLKPQGPLSSLDQLEVLALENRPEIMEEHYQARISATEVKKAMLEMLPGLEVSLGRNHDNNDFLYNSTWSEYGASITWNVFNVFSGPANIRVAETQVELDDARRMALNMAVLTQVHLAYQRYQIALHDFKVSGDLVAVEDRIQEHMEAERKAAVENELEVIRSMASGLVSHMQYDLGYAELQNAIGRIQNSVGVDPLPGVSLQQDIKSLAAIVEQQIQQQTM
jgi:outer membrane protein TolC